MSAGGFAHLHREDPFPWVVMNIAIVVVMLLYAARFVHMPSAAPQSPFDACSPGPGVCRPLKYSNPNIAHATYTSGLTCEAQWWQDYTEDKPATATVTCTDSSR